MAKEVILEAGRYRLDLAICSPCASFFLFEFIMKGEENEEKSEEKKEQRERVDV